MSDYVARSTPFEDAPSTATPIRADWLNPADAMLAELGGPSGRVKALENWLPERATLTAAAAAASLLGQTNRFDTTGGAIAQPLPAATAGRTFAIGWDAGTAGLTYTAAGSDVIGSGSAASGTVFFPGEVVTFHCSVAGRWRATSSFTPRSALDARFAPSRVAVTAREMHSPRFDDFWTDGVAQTLPARAVMPTGHPYTLGVVASGGSGITTSDIQVLDGDLWLNGRGACYAWTVNVLDDVDEASVAMIWKAGTTTGVTAFALIFSKIQAAGASTVDPFLTGIHLSIQRTAILAQENVGGTVGVSPDSVTVQTCTYSASIPDNIEVVLTCRRIGHDRIRLSIPGYLDQVVTCPRLPQLWGSTVGIETLSSAATWATDPRPVIRGHRVGPPPRRGLPSIVPTSPSALGIPGAVYTGTAAVTTYLGGTDRHWPFVVEDPVTVSGAYLAVETTAAASGSKARLAIHSLGADLKQRSLIVDFGEVAIDAVSSVIGAFAGTPITLWPGIYALSHRASGDATYRCCYHHTPRLPVVRNLLTALPFPNAWTKPAQTYGAWPAAPVAWDTVVYAGVPGFLCPIQLLFSRA